MNRRSRVVGITVCLDRRRLRPGRDYVYVARDYARAVAAAGAVPVLLSPDSDPHALLSVCDAVVFSGGDDVPAWLWRGVQGPASIPEDRERVEWELGLMRVFLEDGRRVLGVCYGMQLLNVSFGGSLVQEIADQFGRNVDHGGGGAVTEHTIEAAEGSLVRALIGPRAAVSSSHHQAVERLGAGLRATATAADGVVEAIEGDQVLGVEWHPELDGTARAVYGFLAAAAA